MSESVFHQIRIRAAQLGVPDVVDDETIIGICDTLQRKPASTDTLVEAAAFTLIADSREVSFSTASEIWALFVGAEAGHPHASATYELLARSTVAALMRRCWQLSGHIARCCVAAEIVMVLAHSPACLPSGERLSVGQAAARQPARRVEVVDAPVVPLWANLRAQFGVPGRRVRAADRLRTAMTMCQVDELLNAYQEQLDRADRSQSADSSDVADGRRRLAAMRARVEEAWLYTCYAADDTLDGNLAAALREHGLDVTSPVPSHVRDRLQARVVELVEGGASLARAVHHMAVAFAWAQLCDIALSATGRVAVPRIGAALVESALNGIDVGGVGPVEALLDDMVELMSERRVARPILRALWSLSDDAMLHSAAAEMFLTAVDVELLSVLPDAAVGRIRAQEPAFRAAERDGDLPRMFVCAQEAAAVTRQEIAAFAAATVITDPDVQDLLRSIEDDLDSVAAMFDACRSPR